MPGIVHLSLSGLGTYITCRETTGSSNSNVAEFHFLVHVRAIVTAKTARRTVHKDEFARHVNDTLETDRTCDADGQSLPLKYDTTVAYQNLESK